MKSIEVQGKKHRQKYLSCKKSNNRLKENYRIGEGVNNSLKNSYYRLELETISMSNIIKETTIYTIDFQSYKMYNSSIYKVTQLFRMTRQAEM